MKLDEVLKDFLSSILAGCVIGLGGAVLLSVNVPVLNALFFSVCLLSIVQLKLKLYTGAIGFLYDGSKPTTVGTMYLGNIVGVWIFGNLLKMTHLAIPQNASKLLESKAHMLQLLPLWDILLVGFLCGVLVHIAVGVWKTDVVKSEFAKVVITLWGITSFILCGFEHCIADAFYLCVASPNIYPIENQVVFILLLTIGNGLGGLVSHWAFKLSKC